MLKNPTPQLIALLSALWITAVILLMNAVAVFGGQWTTPNWFFLIQVVLS